MIGNRPIKVLRASTVERDAEGRAMAARWVSVATVRGNLFSNRVNEYQDGQLIVVWEHKALLPAQADVRERDVLEADGERFTVVSITKRRGPDGRVHHLSLECERATR